MTIKIETYYMFQGKKRHDIAYQSGNDVRGMKKAVKNILESDKFFELSSGAFVNSNTIEIVKVTQEDD